MILKHNDTSYDILSFSIRQDFSDTGMKMFSIAFTSEKPVDLELMQSFEFITTKGMLIIDECSIENLDDKAYILYTHKLYPYVLGLPDPHVLSHIVQGTVPPPVKLVDKVEVDERTDDN